MRALFGRRTDRIERLDAVGLDVERQNAKLRPIVARLDERVAILVIRRVPVRITGHHQATGHEALHQKTIGGLDVGFVKARTTRAQEPPRVDECASSGKVHPVDRSSGKRGKLERPRAPAQLFGVHAPSLGKPYGFLPVDLNPDRSGVARRPEDELDPVRRVAPLPGEQKRPFRTGGQCGRTQTSTRRFDRRPSSSTFEARGSELPRLSTVKRWLRGSCALTTIKSARENSLVFPDSAMMGLATVYNNLIL